MIRIGRGVPGRRLVPAWTANVTCIALGALLTIGLLAYGGIL